MTTEELTKMIEDKFLKAKPGKFKHVDDAVTVVASALAYLMEHVVENKKSN